MLLQLVLCASVAGRGEKRAWGEVTLGTTPSTARVQEVADNATLGLSPKDLI